MTTPWLADDVSQDEGFSGKAYPDPLTGKEPWTCGFGCTGADIGPNTVWTMEIAVQRRDAKLVGAITDLDRNIPWWRSLCDARQDVLANMAYNMGWPRLAGFKRFFAALQAHDYAKASAEMIDSRWAHQLPRRAGRLARQMLRGERQQP